MLLCKFGGRHKAIDIMKKSYESLDLMISGDADMLGSITFFDSNAEEEGVRWVLGYPSAEKSSSGLKLFKFYISWLKTF